MYNQTQDPFMDPDASATEWPLWLSSVELGANSSPSSERPQRHIASALTLWDDSHSLKDNTSQNSVGNTPCMPNRDRPAYEGEGRLDVPITYAPMLTPSIGRSLVSNLSPRADSAYRISVMRKELDVVNNKIRTLEDSFEEVRRIQARGPLSSLFQELQQASMEICKSPLVQAAGGLLTFIGLAAPLVLLWAVCEAHKIRLSVRRRKSAVSSTELGD